MTVIANLKRRVRSGDVDMEADRPVQKLMGK